MVSALALEIIDEYPEYLRPNQIQSIVRNVDRGSGLLARLKIGDYMWDPEYGWRKQELE